MSLKNSSLPTSKEELDTHRKAYDETFKFYDENTIMSLWYSQKLVNVIKKNNFKSVISLGIGQKVVIRKVLSEIEHPLNSYVIIEGSKEVVNKFKKETKLPSFVKVVYSLFEDFVTDEKHDLIEMCFVLEHVEDPVFILRKYKRFIKSNGSIFITVPNARSLHRIIGYKAGIIDDLYRLSRFDLEAGHKRYFDLDSIKKIVRKSGLRIASVKGIFLKPLSTEQLKILNLSSEVINSLCLIAEDYPEISNAIFIEAVP